MDLLDIAWREPQHPVHKLIADPPQKAFSKPALIGIDIEFKQPVDDHQQQEDAAQRHQARHAVKGNAVRIQ